MNQSEEDISKAVVFLSFVGTLGDKYGKKLKNNATKSGIDAAKSTSKRVVQKPADVKGDFMGNKIADQLTSVGKPKNKEKKDKTNEVEET